MKKYCLLPYDYSKKNNKKIVDIHKSHFELEEYLEGKDALFFDSARKGIHYLMEYFHLNREDEVYISTTSGSKFVSTCVLATIFNYSKLSRVLTEKTKLIFIIHEFGFFNEDTFELVNEGKKRNIPVVEDCAHSFLSYYKGKRLGTIADFGLYSMPKTFPVKNGGVLIGNKFDKEISHFNLLIHEKQQKCFLKYLPYLNIICKTRIENYNLFKRLFQGFREVFNCENSCPFVFGFYSLNDEIVHNKFDGSIIEFARTYNTGWVLLPVHYLLDAKDISKIHNLLEEYV